MTIRARPAGPPAGVVARPGERALGDDGRAAVEAGLEHGGELGLLRGRHALRADDAGAR